MMDKSNEEQTTLYTKYWRRLEEVFDNSKGMEDFFRYYLAAITGEYSAKHILYQAFKDYWHKGAMYQVMPNCSKISAICWLFCETLL